MREKGVFELLSAYAKLDESMREGMGLVLRGKTARLDRELEERGVVHLSGSDKIRRLCPAGAVGGVLCVGRNR